MSYANFKETIWSKYIQHEKEKLLTFKADCDYKFEGEAKQGKQVKILGVGRPTIKKYLQAPLSMEFSRQEYLEWVAMPSSRESSHPRD